MEGFAAWQSGRLKLDDIDGGPKETPLEKPAKARISPV